MGEKRTTIAESRKKSSDKKGEAKKKLDSQRRSRDNINSVMEQVGKLGTTGFSDTDQKVMGGAEKIGKSAEQVGQEDAKVTNAATENLNKHGAEMEKVAKQAASEGAKAETIRSSDSRLTGAQELRTKYKEAETAASDISRGDKQVATETHTEGKSIIERVRAVSKKRPSFS